MFEAKQFVSQSVEATITRADGTVENLGVIAFHHRNPLKTIAWRIKQRLLARRAGRIKT